MILSIILLFIIVVIIALLIMFLFYKLLPSIKNQDKSFTEDAVISKDEVEFIKPSLTANNTTNKRAVVLCNCNKSFNRDRASFNKEHTCFLINSTLGTGTDCKYACIGLGDCARVCPQQAIKIVNNTAIISSLCVGCGKCVDVCPLHIIQLLPDEAESCKLCSNSTTESTSCTANQKDEKLSWDDKKDFKIWSYCYKIIKNIIKN